MSGKRHILAIDQGTTSTRAIVFSDAGAIVTSAQQEFSQHFPDDGWVEHDAEEIWRVTCAVCREALAALPEQGAEVAGIGITNQRETTVIWDRASGEPIHRAIVWQDRRTADRCIPLREAGHEPDVTARSGLLLDPYFSGTKIGWLLDHVDGARERAQRGELAFGTIDTWLIWKLTGGKRHVTDATNASRTLLFNIHEQCWDPVLLELLDVPDSLLPEVLDCSADFGVATEGIGIELPIAGVAGDQQAALVGQACFEPGMVKSTYGTGCFAVLNTGDTPVQSRNRLLTTIGYRLDGKTTYALEGSIFVAGAAVQWLRDAIHIIGSAAETEELAKGLESNRGVYLVPAFTGLGAPYWDPLARGAIFGLTRDTGIAELVRAALESTCYQTRDLFNAMADDADYRPAALRVDGGMVANNWLLQCLADLVDVPVERPEVIETTALGAAYLAGLHLGVFDARATIADRWRCDRRCEPAMDPDKRARAVAGWDEAMRQVRSYADAKRDAQSGT
ncbi:glycerol kinase GlpK [Methylonatrum kenyense]|uniref:glycerol kinase GlpK n=1 Tax=Methylonatrum kenyense TaxID=455253 RepID=UPI0020BF3DAD|nr:glycerol kinase GlpK [Methylonatrum kenyense]MCK8516692.1 glycerol kinase GlpK [Methylonatrum kenyense]